MIAEIAILATTVSMNLLAFWLLITMAGWLDDIPQSRRDPGDLWWSVKK